MTNELSLRLREVILDGKWVAFTNYKELLADLTWKQATREIHSLNSIAALTFHINYYIQGVIPVFQGGELTISDKFSWDMKPITNEDEWEALKTTLYDNTLILAQHIENLNNDFLNKPFVKEEYGTYLRNIEGMIEHNYYHMGQIAIIKKMILKSETTND